MRRCRRSLLFAALLLLTPTLPAHAANDPGFDMQWNLHKIGAEPAWPTGTGLDVTIAVVDTGVALEHPDLKDKVLPGHNFVVDGASAQDNNGHGTHVAGIAAAATNNSRGIAGVAADARILPVKVLGSNGSGSEENVAAGIRWAVENRADVVNISLGVEVTADFDKQKVTAPAPSSAIIDAIDDAWREGVICVVAAGNSGQDLSVYSREPALVVGATDRNDVLAAYSNKVGAAKWGLVAPGGTGTENTPHEDNVLSTYTVDSTDTYAWAAGTSMAAPHVAGAAAILLGLGLTPQQTVDRLLATATDLGDAGKDTTYGSGRLDLAKAVEGLTPVATRSATGKPSSTPTTQLRATPTTRVRAASTPRTTPTSVTPTTGVAKAGGSGGSSGEAPVVTVDVVGEDELDGDGDGDDRGDAEVAGAPGDDSGDGLPLGPPLVATVLWAATARRLLRVGRV